MIIQDLKNLILSYAVCHLSNTGKQLKKNAKNGSYYGVADVIEKGGNLNEGLYGACLGGHEKIVALMIEKGADDLDLGLCGACLSGHEKIVELMIEEDDLDLDLGLQIACGVEPFPELKMYKRSFFVEQLCVGGNKEIINLLIEKGAKVNWGLLMACYSGYKKIVELMIEKGACNLNEGLCAACECKHEKIIKLLIEKGADYCDWCNNANHKAFF